jgi:hypothetical protein
MLARGQRFQMDGRKWKVVSVSESRAHCVSTVRQLVTVNDRKSGGTRTFEATRRITIDISPNSAVELLGRER